MSVYKLVLASGSPRRKEILENLKFDFEIVLPDIDEELTDKMSPAKLAYSLSEDKVLAVKSKLGKVAESRWIAAFDTIVVCRGKVLGKPESRDKAGEMLELLSGTTHEVITGMALSCPGEWIIQGRAVKTRVKFRKMAEHEIDFYLDTDEWQGVAGAYRIQQRASFFIDSISGCYFNVVGLPVSEFYKILEKNNYSFS